MQTEKLKMKKGETKTIFVQFMPFKLENYKCYLVFQDPNVGEFQHEIMGETTLPEVMEESRPSLPIFVD